MAEWEKKVKRDLLDNGFSLKRQGKGSHQVWSNGDISVILSHRIDKNLANFILKDAGINKRY